MLSSVLYHLVCIMTPTISAGLDEWSEVPHNQRGTWIARRITRGDAEVATSSDPG